MFEGNNEFMWEKQHEINNRNKFRAYLVCIFGKIHETQGNIKLM